MKNLKQKLKSNYKDIAFILLICLSVGAVLISTGGTVFAQDWDCRTQSEATGDVRSVRFDPDNNYLASGSKDQNVYVYDTSDWSLVQTLTDATNEVVSVSWSPTGDHLASGGKDHNVYIYDVPLDIFPKYIEGTVYLDGEPQGGVTIRAYLDFPDHNFAKVTTDSNGYYKIKADVYEGEIIDLVATYGQDYRKINTYKIPE